MKPYLWASVAMTSRIRKERVLLFVFSLILYINHCHFYVVISILACCSLLSIVIVILSYCLFFKMAHTVTLNNLSVLERYHETWKNQQYTLALYKALLVPLPLRRSSDQNHGMVRYN